MLQPMSTRISRRLSLAAAFAAVLFLTVMFKKIAVINATTVGFAYLITILLIAASWGIAESVLASIVATICLNYFLDRKSTRLNSSHVAISYAVFCLKKKK